VFLQAHKNRIGAGLIAIAALFGFSLITAGPASAQAGADCVSPGTGGGLSAKSLQSRRGTARRGAPRRVRSGGFSAASINGGRARTNSAPITPVVECAPPGKARLVNGRAIAPVNAPLRVKKVIAWANKIRHKPYIYGGGHGRFFDRGYDCSGAISFGLRGGGFVRSPMASTGYMSWATPGRGRWITVYTNPGHAYVVVAGLRFDTSMTGGNGPRWSDEMRSPRGFAARHPAGL